MASSCSPPPPITSSLSPQINYDVFLSFRGEDTRRNFTSHLHNALNEKGIKSFIDDKLNRGDEISPALFEAIEQSKISVIIFSEDYASSNWCLEELIKILDCRKRGQTVIPIFYGITPSDVRNQTGSFAKAFAEHEKRFKKRKRNQTGSLDQVHKWKVALKEAADISGLPSSTDNVRSEAEVIKDIVKDVLQKLDDPSLSDISKLVGIHSKIKEVESLLCIGTNNVCSVGIWGIGGIGKTTLAESVFNKISSQFEGSYFAGNVRERCKTSDGLHFLQREILSALLGGECVNIGTSAIGRTFIKSRLGCKKLLITLDDVSDFTQVEDLIGGFDCLGPQSRIIITSRDKQVLKNYSANQIYEIQKLHDNEAFELFCKYAFKGMCPMKEYEELSKKVIKYTGGIPSALKFLGSDLFETKIEVWKSSIEKWEENLPTKIYNELKISYDGLDFETQKIFLDIACFFKCDKIEYVKSALEACGFHSSCGINDLIKKSLIFISLDKEIKMHHLVEAMGKQIVKQEGDPGKRSRLWHHDDIYHVLTENTVTENIEGIALNMSKLEEHIHLKPCDFLKMCKLRIMKLYYPSSSEMMKEVYVSEGLEYDLIALRHLSWHGCSIRSPLPSLRLKFLVTLDMRWSKLEQLWNGVLLLVNLKEVDLSESKLTSCPDFSGFPNLKKLNLFGCEDLLEISSSIGCLNKLGFLKLCRCSSLKEIPNCSGLSSLRDLNLDGCGNLEMLYEMPCNLESFHLNSPLIEELPSFEKLRRLQKLCLSKCEKLKRLPSSFCKLKSLKTLNLLDCSKLDHLPNDIGSLESLESLHAKGVHIRELPSSMMDLKNLKDLGLDGLEVSFEKLPDYLANDEELPDGMKLCEVSMNLSKREMVNCLPKEQLGGTRADNQTVMEVLSCLPIQDIMKADFEDIVNDTLHGLQKIKQTANIRLDYLGCEVPKWFKFRSEGNSILVKQSSHWLNHNFIGFALCIVVAPCQDCEEYCDISWTCKLKSKDGHTLSSDSYYDTFSVKSSHVFVKSLILPFSRRKLLYDEFEFFSKFASEYSSRHFKIDKCGVHLMFSQHFEEVSGSSRIVKYENIFTFSKVDEEDQE